MRLLFYSSPYQYYWDNLEPLVSFAKIRGHEVYYKKSLKEESSLSKIYPLNNKKEKTYSVKDLILNKKIDAVVLTQPWWYADRAIADLCVKNRVKFYIVDHAPPIIKYSERNGKKSHIYRSRLMGSSAFFAYGQETKKIMQERGCKEKIVVTGSPRIEAMEKKYRELSKRNPQKDFKSCVVFDTSHRMEDERMVDIFREKIKRLDGDWRLFVREHSRSPKFFSKNIEGISVIEGPEEQVIHFADLVMFSFPSSAMILPAIVGKPISPLYEDHFSEDARRFYRKFRKDMPINPRLLPGDYSLFLAEHYKMKGSPTKKIIKYIERENG